MAQIKEQIKTPEKELNKMEDKQSNRYRIYQVQTSDIKDAQRT